MKIKKRTLHQQRRQLDQQLRLSMEMRNAPRPRLGWLKAIRESLGMTTRQLASILGTDNAAVLRLENREVKGTATIEAVERAAKAMGCRFVYAIVPDDSLEKIVDNRAHEAAARLLKPVAHSMRLEKQGVSDLNTEEQIEALAQELKSRLDPALWEK